VLYTALQGKSYGEHRLIGSDCLYDSCRSVPLLIRYPRFIKAGSLTTGLASTGDIAATIRQLVGLPPPSEGISLLPLFTRPNVPVIQSLFYEMPSQASGSAETDHAIRTKDFMYAELASGEREFYDLLRAPLHLGEPREE